MARMSRWMLWVAQLKEHRGFQTSRAVQYEASSEPPPKNAAAQHRMLRLHASHHKCYVSHQNTRYTLTSHSNASNHLLCCSERALYQQGVLLHPKPGRKLLEVSNHKKLCVNSVNPSMIQSVTAATQSVVPHGKSQVQGQQIQHFLISHLVLNKD